MEKGNYSQIILPDFTTIFCGKTAKTTNVAFFATLGKTKIRRNSINPARLADNLYELYELYELSDCLRPFGAENLINFGGEERKKERRKKPLISGFLFMNFTNFINFIN